MASLDLLSEMGPDFNFQLAKSISNLHIWDPELWEIQICNINNPLLWQTYFSEHMLIKFILKTKAQDSNKKDVRSTYQHAAQTLP